VGQRDQKDPYWYQKIIAIFIKNNQILENEYYNSDIIREEQT